MIKVILGFDKIEDYKNAWMNLGALTFVSPNRLMKLALPYVMLSEPQSCPTVKIHDDLTINLWTKR